MFVILFKNKFKFFDENNMYLSSPVLKPSAPILSVNC